MNWNLAFWREFIAQLGDAPTSLSQELQGVARKHGQEHDGSW